MAREVTDHEKALVNDMVARARAAMVEIADFDQARVDRLAQAIGWALGNEATFLRLAHMSVDESGIGDREGRARNGSRFTASSATRCVRRVSA